MDANQPVPYMRLTSDPSSSPPRVKRGMTMEQVREIWVVRAEAINRDVMGKYAKQRREHGSGGREGLGIYGQFQSRVKRKKEELAERLLRSAGLPTDDATIGKVMRR